MKTLEDRKSQIKTAFERNQQALTLLPTLGRGTAVTRVRMVDGLTCEVEEGPWKIVADMGEKSGGGNAGPNLGFLGRAAERRSTMLLRRPDLDRFKQSACPPFWNMMPPKAPSGPLSPEGPSRWPTRALTNRPNDPPTPNIWLPSSGSAAARDFGFPANSSSAGAVTAECVPFDRRQRIPMGRAMPAECEAAPSLCYSS